MKFKLFLITCFMVMFCSQLCFAQEKLQMPDGINTEVDGKKGVFFTLEEYKEIGIIYVNYVKNLDKIRLTNFKYDFMLDIEKSYDLKVENCKDYTKVVEYDRDFWKVRYTDLKSTISLMEKKHRLKSTLQWVGIGTLSLSTLVLSLRISLD